MAFACAMRMQIVLLLLRKLRLQLALHPQTIPDHEGHERSVVARRCRWREERLREARRDARVDRLALIHPMWWQALLASPAACCWPLPAPIAAAHPLGPRHVGVWAAWRLHVRRVWGLAPRVFLSWIFRGSGPRLEQAS